MYRLRTGLVKRKKGDRAVRVEDGLVQVFGSDARSPSASVAAGTARIAGSGAATWPSSPARPSAGDEPLAGRLSPREREIVQLIAEGHASKKIAAGLHVSEKTVEAHRGNILRKLGLRSAVDLVRYAIRNRIIEP
jgi:DNA-binding NarL/FixJ family response regulator